VNPIRTPISTSVELGVPGTDVAPLPSWREFDARRGATVVASIWEPTPEERAAIAAGANLMLAIWQDPIPPVSLSVVQGEEFERLVALERVEAPPS
jgi:hypothetical protein